MDLGRLTFLTVVGTQGRYARNTGNEFTRAYRLNYSRDGLLWKSWRDRLGKVVSDPNFYGVARDWGEMKEMSQEESKYKEIWDGMIEVGSWGK